LLATLAPCGVAGGSRRPGLRRWPPRTPSSGIPGLGLRVVTIRSTAPWFVSTPFGFRYVGGLMVITANSFIDGVERRPLPGSHRRHGSSRRYRLAVITISTRTDFHDFH
jgi:hypothetical protein